MNSPGPLGCRSDGIRRVTILGSTGSIGQSTIDLLSRNPDGFDFTVFALEPQWRTKPELEALQRVGANRVVLWLLRPDLKSILEEMDQLARTALG